MKPDLTIGQPIAQLLGMTASEIIFEVREDEVDGGFNARALGHDIFTQA